MKKFITIAVAAAVTATPVIAETPQAPAAAPQEPIKAVLTQPAAASQASLPANTPIVLSMNDELTTKGGRLQVGTPFHLSVVHDVKVGQYIVVPKGSRGMGEVTWLTGKGAFGKSGKMEVELRYVEVNGQRIPLVGKFRQEGEGNTVATVGTVIVAGVFAAFVTGKSAVIPRGRELTAHTKDELAVALPMDAIAPAPLQAIAPASPTQPAVVPVSTTPTT